MAEIRHPHYVRRKGIHGYWVPTPTMRALGFRLIPCGHDGPAAWAIADEWEQRYQRTRKGLDAAPRKTYLMGSVGDAFDRYRRTNSWKLDKAPRTREDWERGWQFIEPYFSDMAPAQVTLELLDSWYSKKKQQKGVGEAGRALKIWRALYNVMAAMHLCLRGGDPSLAIRKESVPGRKQTWRQHEIVRLAKAAWRSGHGGLACIIAVAWDTQFSPVDVRALTARQAVASGHEWGFLIDRTKTGEAAYGTLSRRSRRLVETYISELGFELLETAPIFRTRGHIPGPKGGRPRAGTPYTKDSLIGDFAEVRRLVFGPAEKRRLMDMRRSGAVEANAGGASVEAISAKMSNSIDQNKTLQKTYMPVNLAAVRAADDARKIGRKRIGEEQNVTKKFKLGAKPS